MTTNKGPLRTFSGNIPVHFIVAGSAWASRVITTLISLLTIRLLIEGLGVQHYAVYALLVGTSAWFMLSDFSLGLSLQNYISESRANQRSYHDYIWVTFIIILSLTIITISALYFASPLLASMFLKRSDFLTQSQKIQDLFLIGALAICTYMGSIVYRIWYAEQRGYLANILPAISAFIGLVSVYRITQSHLEDKLFWCLVGVNAPSALLPFAAFVLKVESSVKVKPKLTQEIFVKLFRRAWSFWLFNIAAAAVLQVDYIALSQVANASEVVIYNVSTKMYSLAGFIYGAVLQAFWPVCSEWLVKGKWKEVMAFTARYIIGSVFFIVIFTILIILFIDKITKIFIPQGDVVIPIAFISFLGFSYLVRVWTDIFAVILQSMSEVRPLLKLAIIQALINISLQFILAPMWGIYGVVAAMTLSFLLTVSAALPRIVFGHMKSEKAVI